MTALEPPPQVKPKQARPVPKPARRSRFADYFVTRGWAHLILLSGTGIFLFPLLWMLSTSIKSDEE